VARRLTFLVIGLLALSACRLDVAVSVEMEPDGTGVVTLDAVADAGLIEQVPTLIDDLRLDDAIANGWVTGGPILQPDGGATLTLTHDFNSAEELANVLNSIGPPFLGMEAARTPEGEQTTNAVNGDLILVNGFESFADNDLIQTVGGVPFAEQFAANGAVPSEVMSVTFRVDLPGELISSETGTDVGDGVFEWQAPLDGTSLNVFTSTVQRPAPAGGSWAGPLSMIALVLLVAWVVAAAAFIMFVTVARRKKQRRRDRALRRLG